MKDCHINLFLNEDDGLWVPNIPDLPRCSAPVETPEEALREAQLARPGWLEVAQAIGKIVPSGLD